MTLSDAGRPDLDAELLAFDAAHVWHPYSSIPGSAPLLVDSAEGVHLNLLDGRQLIDAMSSWWAAIHGYRNPILDAAVTAQLSKMSHVMFGGLTHAPAVHLAQRLIEITPVPLNRVFFSDSGSVAVEVAAKMALQYWVSRGLPAKHRLMTWRGGYHGDTLHPMSVCDPESGMHALWRDTLPEQVFVPAPPPGVQAELDAAYLSSWDQALSAHAHEVAAIIVEPVVQGAGGMTFHNPGYLTALRELADRHNVLLIFDEIATGFGRTGALFAADHASVSPDIMCLGKAMTGGYLSMAATLCTREIADQISAGQFPVLAHGPTFMANPLAAAVSLASIDLLLSQNWSAEVARIETELSAGLSPLVGHQTVKEVRVLGAIGVVQLKAPVDVAAATDAAVMAGVWIRPFSDLIYTMPPYIASNDEVAQICMAIVAAVDSQLLGGGR
ncbi:MAG: adenosylmethionine--8-amino-7-oxononanoate transaminase [Actinomycetota bacterium]|nr:adenosylmethionine--8-amino-7-oxononanoate transaminase [Actinomycetota bacterium]